MVHKHVTDLGVAAYLMMHKYKVIGRQGRAFYFEVPDKEITDFDQLSMDYLCSEYHRFDSAIMALKKVADYMPK